MTNRPANAIVAAISGALIALALAFLLSWAGLYAGVANITAPGAKAEHGKAALSRAALNLYAMQHVTLKGSGLIATFAGPQKVSDSVTLPITLWAFIPALSLLAGGYVAGRRRIGAKRMGLLISSILSGVFYAIVLCAGSLFVKAKLDPSALPVIDGTSFNPHDILLSPDILSAALSAGLFGVVFAYLGGMIVLRGERQLQPIPGQWWVCGKALIVVAAVVQLVMTATIGIWLLRANSDKLQGSSRTQILALSPTATGIAYSLLYGGTLTVNIESLREEGAVQGMANLYSGIDTDKLEQPRRMKTVYIIAIAFIGALMAFIAGVLAVKWGSRSGAVITAVRIVILQAVYLAILAFLCRIGWSSGEGGAAYKLIIELRFGAAAWLCLVEVFFASLLGAYLTSRWYVNRRGYV
ncbi:MAG: hypothetical protein NT018_06480 [Armatimonadetes bacterium]|nr:hypothetical protein [Armatimonadota bacterium]